MVNPAGVAHILRARNYLIENKFSSVSFLAICLKAYFTCDLTDACSSYRVSAIEKADLFRSALSMVNPAGVEPATSCTANKRSIHLSYGSRNVVW